MFRSWRILMLCCVCLITGQASAGEAKSFALTMAYVQSLEARMKLPKGAKPIVTYVRYYSLHQRQGRDFVVGIFMRGEINRQPGARIVDFNRLPYVSGGGCDIIDFAYDVAKKKTTQLACHGNG